MLGANAMRVSLVAMAVLVALWVQDVGAFGFSTKGRGQSTASCLHLAIEVHGPTDK